VKAPLLLKALSLFAVVILLMFGIGRIGDIASERSMYRQHAVESVRKSLAGSQTIAGVVLTRTCKETVQTITETAKGKTIEKTERTSILRALPQSVKWSSQSMIEPRYRGLYKVNSFNLSAKALVQWSDIAELTPPPVKDNVVAVVCADPRAEFSVSDARGIRSIKLMSGTQTLKPEAIVEGGAFRVGFAAKLPIAEAALKEAVQLNLDIDLVGTESLAFVPLGNENLVEINSSWPHPSFAGSFLPLERSVRDDGFVAKWSVSSLASTARSQLLRGGSPCAGIREGSENLEVGAHRHEYASTQTPQPTAANLPGCLQSFGVSFIDPVNPSSLSDRATKYAILFIALTFVGLVLLEVLKGVRVHALQYLLIGAALATFFLLLLSLSEHIAFGWAYLAAAGACLALIGVYVKAVLGGWSRAGSTVAGLTMLYGVLYLVLQSEQHALLAGSLLIFAVLAGVMLLTRGVNWSAFSSRITKSENV
jgi:inner membrane protein